MASIPICEMTCSMTRACLLIFHFKQILLFLYQHAGHSLLSEQFAVSPGVWHGDECAEQICIFLLAVTAKTLPFAQSKTEEFRFHYGLELWRPLSISSPFLILSHVTFKGIVLSFPTPQRHSVLTVKIWFFNHFSSGRFYTLQDQDIFCYTALC